jgi:radical SAM protein with 4Fe4S-binding SPASM domain
VTLNLNPALADVTIGEWLASTKHSMTFSFDGPAGAQNASRLFCGGKDSFDTVMASLEHLKAVNPEYAKRISFRATLFNNLEQVSVKDRLEFFNGLIERGIGAGVHFEPASGNDDEFRDGFPLLESQYYEAADWYIAQIKAGKSPKWNDMAKRVISRLFNLAPATGNCGAGCSYFTCGIDGAIYACHRTAGAKIGSLQDGIDFEEMSRWNNNSVMFLEKCMTCPIRYLCGGNCRAANCSEAGDTNVASERGCAIRMMRLNVAAKILMTLTGDEAERMFKNKPQRAVRTGVNFVAGM